MTRMAERLCVLAAVGISACFLAGVAGYGHPSAGHRISPTVAGYFHEGKPVPSEIRDSACRTETCHGGYPHVQGPESAFRNMHVEFIECPVCHGPEGDTMWTSDPEPGGRWILRPGRRTEESRDPHHAFGPPVRCRDCHSERGRNRIERGMEQTLKGGFDDPVALRMLEEGSRKWIPDGM